MALILRVLTNFCWFITIVKCFSISQKLVLGNFSHCKQKLNKLCASYFSSDNWALARSLTKAHKLNWVLLWASIWRLSRKVLDCQIFWSVSSALANKAAGERTGQNGDVLFSSWQNDTVVGQNLLNDFPTLFWTNCTLKYHFKCRQLCQMLSIVL